MRGGWIEMIFDGTCNSDSPSRPVRGGWIEIRYCPLQYREGYLSRPVRGGWIEIP